MEGIIVEPLSDGAGIELVLHPLAALSVEGSEALAQWEELGWTKRLPGTAVGHRRIQCSPALFEALATLEGEQGSDFLVYQRQQLRSLLGIRPTTARLEALSFVGARTLRFQVRVGESVLPEETAYLVSSAAGIEVLDPCVGWLQRQVRDWNTLGPTNRAQQLDFLGKVQSYGAKLASLGEPVQLVLDEHIREFEVVAPKSVRLQWNSDSSDKFGTYSLSAAAVLPNGETTPLKLDALDPAVPVLQVSGKRFMAFDPDSHQVLRSVASSRQRRTKKEVAPVLERPELLVPPGVSGGLFDLSEYSARVKGFETAEKPKRPQIVRSSGIQWFEAPPDDRPFLEVVVDVGDAPPTVLRFHRPEELLAARDATKDAVVAGRCHPLQVCGREVVPTEALYHQLDLEWALYEASRPATTNAAVPGARVGVVLEDDLQPAEHELAILSGRVPWGLLEELLLPGKVLKEHQRTGIAWMWSSLERGSPGVLLADDMGLGKTLQVAVLVALARAAKRVTRPALVVCPVILLENWQAELCRFFREGAFGTVHVLHGDGVRALTRADGRLDCEVLQSHGLVLTNYETLDRHQQSLLTVDWGCVVLDEAQAIKNPGTFRSRAARALKRDFAVCSTGTPVENRLADLWTLFDFLSPQVPFGSLEEFQREYEAQGSLGAAKARTALHYPSARSKVLRRAKSEVLDLKEKRTIERPVSMTPEQYQLERRLIGMHRAKPKNSALELLGDLEKVYQHPWLLRESEDVLGSVDLIVKGSPKLKACLEILDEVRRREEKVLVFTRWTRMQAILCRWPRGSAAS